tara:strand:+ start:699 stop:1640 length:942 start_codon:yes stop_codon:yes gene_type:complete
LKDFNLNTNGNDLHVVVLANAFQLMLFKAYLNKYSIDRKNVIAILLRNIDVTDLADTIIHPKDNKINRFLWKSLSFSMNSLIILMKLKIKRKYFYLYLPWDNEFGEWLAHSSLCNGFIYLEEGDLSYWSEDVLYRNNEVPKYELKQRRHGPARKFLFNERAKAVICISKECFPCFPQSKKIILDDLSLLDDGLDNKLDPDKVIGVLPSAHRLSDVEIEEIILTYQEIAGTLTHLKMHPSFEAYPYLKKKISQVILEIGLPELEIIGEEVSLEREMLRNKHHLIGLHSSLERYAKKFGSRYTIAEKLTHLQKER